MQKMPVRIIICLLAFFSCGGARAQVSQTVAGDAQFDAGTYTSTYRTGTGSAARISLEYNGRSAGLSAPDNAQWLNAAWNYRRPLTVTSAESSALTDYRLSFLYDTQALVAAGRLRSDGADLRFATATVNGAGASLPYFIESGMNTTQTKIWVKVPSISTGTSVPLYLYCGNTGASAAAAIGSTAIFGDDFTGVDGSSPTATSWANTASGSVLAGSTRDIQSNRLRLRFGTSSGTRYYGVRSQNQYSFSSRRRFHVSLDALSIGSNSFSSITLCPNMASYAAVESDWLRFSLYHSTEGPKYLLERNFSGTVTTLVSLTATTLGYHDVEYVIDSTNLTVLLDGVAVYTNAHYLAFTSAYIYLEAASPVTSLTDYHFDTLFVTPAAASEPTVSTPSAEQGAYRASGSYLSSILDSSAADTRYELASWLVEQSTGTGLTVSVRADNTDPATLAFSTITNNANPGVTGRYVQFRLVLDAADQRYSALFSSLTLTYISPPTAASGLAGVQVASNTITWAWQDNAAGGQFAEQGFRICSDADIQMGSVAANTTSWKETGLFTNTIYTRYVQAYNTAGNVNSSTAAACTLAAPPAVSCDRTPGTWYPAGTTFNFSNLIGFGTNGVGYYRVIWTTAAAYEVWGDTETPWLSGLQQQNAATGSYYLHVKSYNMFGVAGSTQVYGPFSIDADNPTASDFIPSSSSWMNTAITVQSVLRDTGGSLLSQYRTRWTGSDERPYSGWSAWETSIAGTSSATITSNYGTDGIWYLHIEAQDAAGNTGYSCAGPYGIDKAAPSGSVAINGGDAYTAAGTVTLNLTYADAASGVSAVRYRNDGESWSASVLPEATSSWVLTAGNGLKTVEYEITDAAGNFAVYTDTITRDDTSAVVADTVTATVSGEGSGENESFSGRAQLVYAPTGVPLANKTIQFIFNGTTVPAVTSGAGIAAALFDVPATSGTWQYTAVFEADEAYAASSTTAVLIAAPRSTRMTVNDVTTLVSATFTVTARLQDVMTDNDIVNRPVSFVFEGSTHTAYTNAVGIATTTFLAPASTAVVSCAVSYAGDATYAAKNTSALIAVGMHLTNLTASNFTIAAGATMTVQAILREGADPIPAAAILFQCQGISSTTVTAADGMATAAYTAPASSGTYTYSATYAGDDTYYGNSATGTITVTRRAVTLQPDGGVSGYVLGNFTARATLFDNLTGNPVAGESITYIFEEQSFVAVTDALGVSSAVFACGNLARDTTWYAAFGGGGMYAADDVFGNVSIAQRTAVMTAYDVATPAYAVFEARVRLTDNQTSNGIAGRQVSFNFYGQGQAAVTNDVGIATVTYTANLSTGAYTFSATFLDDGIYATVSSTGDVTVTLRPTVMTPIARWILTNDAVPPLAELKDGINGQALPGKTISFIYDGVEQSSTTDSNGRAFATYPSTSIAGTYLYSASFAGDGGYAASSGTASIYVWRRTANLTASAVTTMCRSTFTVTAELKDGAMVLPGQQVTFIFAGIPVTVVTDGLGIATTSYAAPDSTGTYSCSATFVENDTYTGASSTATVTVNRRSLLLTANPKNIPAANSIFVDATLLDTETNAAVAGLPLSFLLAGTTLTATTDGDGFASAGAFTAISTAGVYAYTASFAGNAWYQPAVSTANLTIELRPTSIIKYDNVVIAGSTFTARADLRDNLISAGVAGKALTVTFEGTSRYPVTAAGGVTYSSFTAPSVTGAYSYCANFAGDVTYAAAANTGTLTIVVRPTNLTVSDVSCTATSTFTVTAILRDYANLAVSGQTLSFAFLAQNKTGTTDSNGFTSTTFVAPASTGTYTFTVDFAGDALYGAATVIRNVHINRRTTVLQAIDEPNAVALDTFTVRAVLLDQELGNAPIPGKPVLFTFNSIPQTAYTDADGIAISSYTAPASTGAYVYTAVFTADSLYKGSNSAAVVTVNRRPVTLTMIDLSNIPAQSTFTVTAQVIDTETGAPLAEKTVSFVFQGSGKTAATDAVGVSTATYAAPGSSGTYICTADFGGDSLYLPAASQANIEVVQKPTIVITADIDTVYVGKPFTAGAQLKDFASGLGIADKTLQFNFEGQNLADVTDGSGAAAVEFTAPASSGSYQYSAAFTGDGLYAAHQSTGRVTVSLRPTTVTVNPVLGIALSTFSVAAVVRDYENNTVAGLLVTFTYQSVQKNATTDAGGIATVIYTATASTGTDTYTAHFPGTAVYAESQNSSSVNIDVRPTAFEASNVYVTANSTFTASVALKDYMGIWVATKTVTFTFEAQQKSDQTSSVGVATASYAAPASTGTYPISFSFVGDALYGPAAEAKNVIVGERLSSIEASDVSTVALDSFTVQAVLRDFSNSQPIVGRVVQFCCWNSTLTAVTDVAGVAIATYTATASSGSFVLTATFVTDGYYAASQDAAVVTVARRPVIVDAFDMSSVPALSSFTVTMEIIDAGTGVPVSTRTITFDFQASQKTGTSNAVGVSSVSFTAPGSTGTFTCAVAFAGDALYAAGNDNAVITVVRRPVVVVAYDVATAYVGIPFDAPAVLKDFETDSGIAGKTISFYFSGTTVTAVTSGVGTATGTFTAAASSGTYPYTAYFAGDGVYDDYQSSAAVLVNLRPASFTLNSVTTLANDTMTVTGTLRDTITNAVIPGKTVSFNFLTTTRTVTTDAFGVATSSFVAPTSSGTYTYTGFYAGDTTYAPVAAQGAITVNRRPVLIIPLEATYFRWHYTLQYPVPRLQLVDGNTGVGIASKTIYIVYGGSTATVTTNGTGWAEKQFTPVQPNYGWYPCSAYFNGDTTYQSVRVDKAQGVEFGRRSTATTAYPAATTCATLFNVEAKLIDTISDPDAAIVGKSVKFTFQGSTNSAITDANGVARSTFTAPGTIGVYQVRADFLVDSTYSASFSTNAVTVGYRDTMLVAMPEVTTTGAGKPFTARAKLLDVETSTGVAGRTIEFVFQGTTVTATTSSVPPNVGIAEAAFTAPVVIDTYTFVATFYGDTVYSGSATSGTVMVEKNASTLTGQNVVAATGNDFAAQATLTFSSSGLPVVGKSITFIFDSTSTITRSSITNGLGIATMTFSAAISTGTYNYRAYFYEDSNCLASSDTANSVTVTRRPTSMAAQNTSVYIYDSFIAQSALTDTSTTGPVGGKAVGFIVHNAAAGDTTAYGTSTFAAGISSAVFVSPVSSGTYNYCAFFNGDDTYDASSDTRTVTVSLRVTQLSADTASAETNDTFTAQATLVDNTPTLAGATINLSTMTVRFVFNGTTVYAVTNDIGVATATFTAPASSGTFNYTALFAGTTIYAPSQDLTNVVTITGSQTAMTGAPVNCSVNSLFWVTATLINQDGGAKIQGRTVRFVFDSTTTITKYAITDVNGLATIDFISPLTPAEYTYHAYFDGDAAYDVSSTLDIVTVNAGSTTITTSDYVAIVDELFVASATLISNSIGLGIPDKNVAFTYRGVTEVSPTNANGVASYQFNAGLSSGTYQLDVEFESDGSYIGDSSSSTVTVLRRPLSVQVSTVAVKAMDVFLATATLTDVLKPGVKYPSNREVLFTMNYSTYTLEKSVYTNGIGVATVTYTAPVSSGPYILYAFFAGDSTYQEKGSSGTISVSRRLVSVSVNEATSTAKEVFVATATVRDRVLGYVLPDMEVTFTLTYGTFTVQQVATTDGSGMVTTAYSAPISSGNYQLDAVFAGNATYDYGSGSSTVHVLRRPVSLGTNDAGSIAMEVFIATGTITDGMNGDPVGNRTVRFTLNYGTFTIVKNGISNAVGVATVTYSAPVSSGSYQLDTAFLGDGTYNIGSGSGTVVVTQRSSEVSLQDAEGMIEEVFASTGTFRDGMTHAVTQNRRLRFVFESSTYTAVTNSFGIARSTYMAPSSSGSYRVDLYFDGDGTYTASWASGTVVLTPRQLTMAVSTVTVKALDVFVATATLTDVLKPGVKYPANKEVVFTMNYSTYTLEKSVYTNGIGVATVTYTAPVTSGTYKLDAVFTEDAWYYGKVTTGTIIVQRRLVSLAVNEATSTAKEVFVATATLRDQSLGYPLGNMAVTFTLTYSTYTLQQVMYTNSIGVATATYTAPVSSGNYRLDGVFAGDGTYANLSASHTVHVVRRPVSLGTNDAGSIAMEVFIATGTITDGMNGDPVGNRTVRFTLNYGTFTIVKNGVSNAIGVATVTYSAPVSSGSYQLDTAFLGDGTYNIGSGSGTVVVTQRSSEVSLQDAAGMIEEVFASTGTFRDGMTHAVTQNRRLRFVFEASTYTAVTNSFGIARSTYMAPSSSGSYRVDLYFDGDGTYTASWASGTVVLTPRQLTMAVSTVTVKALDVFVATATLTDVLKPGVKYPANKEVVFTMNYSTYTLEKSVYTNGIGVATVTYTAPVTSGTYKLDAVFTEDAWYYGKVTTGTIIVQRRLVSLAVNEATSTAKEVFVATATLRDQSLGYPLGNMAVTFTLTYSTYTLQQVMYTNSIGVATATYTAPVSSGNYRLDGVFAGDRTYANLSASHTVHVVRRPVSLGTNDAGSIAMEVFIATGTITDGMNGDPVGNRTVRFTLNYGTFTIVKNGISNAVGVATVTYSAPVSSGSYQLDTAFLGDGTYNIGSGSGTVVVTQRSSEVSLQDAAGMIEEVFASTGTFRDGMTHAVTQNRRLRFVFEASTYTAVTNSFGIARSTYMAPSSSGSYRVDLYFDGDGTYTASWASGTVVLTPRQLTMAVSTVTVKALDVFVATATLTDVLKPGVKYPANKEVVFTMNYSTYTLEKSVYTNGIGVATVTYTAPVTSGTFTLNAAFAGDAMYDAAAAAGTVNVSRRPVTAAVPDITTTAKDIFIATATLRDQAKGTVLPGITVDFTLNCGTYTVQRSALTNAVGVATVTYTAPVSSGAYRLDAVFDGNATYEARSASATAHIFQRFSQIAGTNGSVLALDVYTATATLTDQLTHAAIPAETVSFVFHYSTFTRAVAAVTNLQGKATVQFAMQEISGAYQIDFLFDGNGTFAPSSSSGTVTVLRRAVTLAAPDHSVMINNVFIASGTLCDALTGQQINEKLITFTFNGEESLAATDNDGTALAPFTANVSSGVWQLDARFDGDTTYTAVSASASVTVVRRPIAVAVADTAGTIYDVFRATATVQDGLSAALVQSAAMRFVFAGSSFTAISDAFGLSYASFTAIASSGPHRIDVYFDGNALYEAGTASATVTINRRQPGLAVAPVETSINTIFTSTATLTDAGTGQGIDARNLTMIFNGGMPAAATTDAAGRGFAPFDSAGLSSGTYTTVVTFDGDAIYVSTAMTGVVSIAQRRSAVFGTAVTAAALDVFFTSATVTDLLTADPIADQSVRFVFNGQTHMATTDAVGVATTTFTAPATAGTYSLTMEFPGNTVYRSSVTAVQAHIEKRPVYVTVLDAVARCTDVFISTAVVRDSVTDGTVNSIPVRFVFQGSTDTVMMSGGKACGSFSAPAVSGTYRIDAYWDGNGTYLLAAGSAAVTVTLRPAQLTALNAAGIINEIFTTTATVTDGVSGSPAAGQAVRFVFAGTTMTAVSDSFGIARATYTAAVSSGTHQINIYFDGNATYEATTATAAAVISRRPMLLAAAGRSSPALDVFTATAAVRDALSGTALQGYPVQVAFAGSTTTALSDAFGIVSATFTAAASSGTYRLDLSFAGDALYESAAASATITVLRRPVTIMPANVAAAALTVYAASATLRDVAAASGVSGQQVRFVIQGVEHAGVTSAVGVATAAFTAPASSGTYDIALYYDGNATYETASSSATLMVDTRETGIAVVPVTAVALSLFTSTATLTDNLNAQPVQNKSLLFTLLAASQTATTAVTGKAAVQFTAPASSGTYAIDVQFAGDATYSGSANMGVLTVLRRPTVITPQNATAYALDVFSATATLRDTYTATPLAGMSIDFIFNGTTVPAVTDAMGQAVAAFTAPAVSGTYICTTRFNGDSTYDISTATSAVAILQRKTFLRALDTTGKGGEPFTLSTTLTDDALRTGVVGRTVQFEFEGQFVNGVTNAVGVATATFMAPTEPKVYNYAVRFFGDYTYAASTAAAKIKIGLLTTLVANDIETNALRTFDGRAKLTDAYSTGLVNRPIRFVFQSSSGTALTNAAGSAQSPFTAPGSTGTYYYQAYFDGDEVYAPSEATGTVKVDLRPTSMIMVNANAVVNSSFTATAEVRDVLTGVGISGCAVQFAFNGSTIAAVTNAAGQGSALFFAAVSTGTQLFTAQFDGNGTYAAVNGTGTVTVTVRPTTLVAYTIADAIVQSSCTARVEFRDNTSNAGIAGAAILFAFQGASVTVLTDAAGIAACSFATPASSGTYFYTATYASDGIYAANDATGTVTVSKRQTMIFIQNMSVRSATSFTAQGRLVDVATQQGIPGMDVIFEFLGSSQTTASNSSGVSTATFAAPAATGTYVMTVTFPTETNTYYAAQATAAVTVGLEFSCLVAADAVQVPIKDTVVLSATLSDSVGVRLPNMPVTFTAWGTEFTGLTNGVGVATAAVTAWGVVTATGSYPYAAEFRGDTTYLAAADTQNVVNVQMRHTLMTAKYIQTAPSTVFIAEAVLNDNVNGSPLAGTALAGMPVQFSFYTGVTTVTVAGITDAVGKSTAAFTAPAATGTYHYDAVFAGDALYVASSDTETVHVVVVTGEGIGTVVNTTPVQAYITDVFTASATLTATGFPVPSKAIDFTFFNGVSTATATAYTDAFGIAQTTFAASALYGTYQYQASYIGDISYAPSEDASAVTIARYPVDLVAIDTAALAGATFTATAVLTDARTFAKLNNKTIQFEFVGTTAVYSASAVTDSSGTAVVTFPAPLQYGIYSFGARFAGDADYAGLISSGSVVIVSNGQDTFIAMEDVRTGVGEVFIATATLTCKGFPVRGKPIHFSFCGLTAISTTSVSGTAAVSFTAPASSGSYACTAAFIGDVDYKGATCAAAIDAVIRECPADPNPVTIVRGADNTVTITWPAVVYTNGHIKGYMVEGTRNFRGAWEPIEFIYSTAPALSVTRSVAAGEHCYFRVKSVSWNKDQESNGLVIVELPDEATAAEEGSAANHIFLSEDHNAWVTIPEQLMENIYTHDGSTVPLQVAVVKEEHAQFLLSYDVTVRDAAGTAVPEFKFTRSRRGIRLEFSYDQLPARSASRAQAVNNQVAIFWHNGVEWIKLGGTNDVIGKTCTLYTLKTGKFALGLAQVAESFTVNKVAPRIFTPEETVTLVNRARFYFENPDAVEVSIRIYDATGALVRRNLEREGDNIMFWDGRDNDGTVVRGGVYLYQIEAGNSIITGTVVVAK